MKAREYRYDKAGTSENVVESERGDDETSHAISYMRRDVANMRHKDSTRDSG
jgi:hypothetical protein